MITKEKRKELLALTNKAIQKIDKIEHTLDGLQKELRKFELIQNIPFELHFRSVLLQAGTCRSNN